MQAGGTWANSSGLGWAISSMGLSRPAAQGTMSSAPSSGAPVPPGSAPAPVPAVSSATPSQATHLQHDNGPLEQSGWQALHSYVVPLCDFPASKQLKGKHSCMCLFKSSLLSACQWRYCPCHSYTVWLLVPHCDMCPSFLIVTCRDSKPQHRGRWMGQ